VREREAGEEWGGDQSLQETHQSNGCQLAKTTAAQTVRPIFVCIYIHVRKKKDIIYIYICTCIYIYI
jgi:hypothetical protein